MLRETKQPWRNATPNGLPDGFTLCNEHAVTDNDHTVKALAIGKFGRFALIHNDDDIEQVDQSQAYMLADFRTRFKWLRFLHNYTTDQVAELLGVTSTAVRMWELGLRKPRPVQLKNIKQLFDTQTI